MNQEYAIRNIRNKIEIASFEGTKDSVAVYNITVGSNGTPTHCDCMGFRKNSQNHKHIEIAKKWKELGEPVLTFFWFENKTLKWNTQCNGMKI